MSHSSQVTKEEYANKHESNITSKMANVWERKIGSEKEHKASPTSVIHQSTEKMTNIDPLTRAGSKKASSDLRRKNTKEIVDTFERMASNKEPRNLGLSGLDKLDKKSRKSEMLGNEKKASGETKEDLKKTIERITKQMKQVGDDLALLKSKIDTLY